MQPSYLRGKDAIYQMDPRIGINHVKYIYQTHSNRKMNSYFGALQGLTTVRGLHLKINRFHQVLLLVKQAQNVKRGGNSTIKNSKEH